MMSNVKALYGEGSKAEIVTLSKKKGNRVCSECGEFDPVWASVDQGVFVCINCSGVFRSFSRVKSVELDDWSEKEIEAMASSGNAKVNDVLEASVPDCWVKPYPNCREIIRREWILSKYKKKEFISTRISQPYILGTKAGWLFKLRKQGSKWQQRWFVLDGRSLRMLYQPQDSTPKHNFPVERINVTLDVDTEKPNSMQIMARMDGKTRNIFVYAESSSELIEWYCAIRSAKQRILKEKHPDWSPEKIKDNLSHDFVKCGYVRKTPSGTIKFQKRWFTLETDRLCYYEGTLDANPLGEILLGSTAEGYSVEEVVNHGEFAFVLNTPRRLFPLIPVPENITEKTEWVMALQQIIQQPPESPSSPSIRGSTYELDLL